MAQSRWSRSLEPYDRLHDLRRMLDRVGHRLGSPLEGELVGDEPGHRIPPPRTRSTAPAKSPDPQQLVPIRSISLNGRSPTRTGACSLESPTTTTRPAAATSSTAVCTSRGRLLPRRRPPARPRPTTRERQPRDRLSVRRGACRRRPRPRGPGGSRSGRRAGRTPRGRWPRAPGPDRSGRRRGSPRAPRLDATSRHGTHGDRDRLDERRRAGCRSPRERRVRKQGRAAPAAPRRRESPSARYRRRRFHGRSGTDSSDRRS